MRLISALAALTIAAMILLLADFGAKLVGPFLEAGMHSRAFMVGCNLFTLFCMLGGLQLNRARSRDANSLWRRTDID